MPVFPKPSTLANLRDTECAKNLDVLSLSRLSDASTDTSSSKCTMGIDSSRSLSTIFTTFAFTSSPRTELGSRTATMRSRFPTLNTIRALRRRPELLFRMRRSFRKDMPSNVLHYFLGTCNIAYTLGVAKYHKCALIGYYSSSPSWLLAILAHRADFTKSVGD